MSTYTDIKDRVRETVSVGFKDRISVQRVRLMNEENEFWGTFRGKFETEGLSLSAVELRGATVVGGALSGVSLAQDVTVDSGGEAFALSSIRQSIEDVATGEAMADPDEFRDALDRADQALSAGPDLQYD